jgi:hypothetical protein
VRRVFGCVLQQLLLLLLLLLLMMMHPPPRRCRRVVFSPFIMRGGEGRAATKDDDCGRNNKRKKARSLFFEGAMEIGAMENEFEDSKIWFYQSRNLRKIRNSKILSTRDLA